MVLTGEERAVHLAREAVELVDAGHREVRDSPLHWIYMLIHAGRLP